MESLVKCKMYPKSTPESFVSATDVPTPDRSEAKRSEAAVEAAADPDPAAQGRAAGAVALGVHRGQSLPAAPGLQPLLRFRGVGVKTWTETWTKSCTT